MFLLKRHIWLSVLLLAGIAASCADAFLLEKRHYRKGFYFHKKHHQLVKHKSKEKNSSSHFSLPATEAAVYACTDNHLHELPEKNHADYAKLATPEKKSIHRKSVVNAAAPLFKKWKALNEDDEKSKRIKNAKKKSRIYFWIGLFLLILSFVGIGDLFPLVFMSAIFFLIVSLVHYKRRKRYQRGDYAVPPADPTVVNQRKAKNARRSLYVFLLLSLLLMVCSLFVPPLFFLVILFLILAWIFSARRRKYEIRVRQKENPTEEEKRMEALDKTESQLAYDKAWLSLLFVFLSLLATFIAFVGFVALAFEFHFLFLLIMLLGIFLGILGMSKANENGTLAREAGKNVLGRHPEEKYYAARHKALFGKRAGLIGKRAWLIILFALLLLVLIVLASI